MSAEVPQLTDLPPQALLPNQLQAFTAESAHVQAVAEIEPATVAVNLQQHTGKLVLGADFGGDKGMVRLMRVTETGLVVTDGYRDDIQGNDGVGYLDVLVKAARYAEKEKLPLGLSWGGPLDGTKPLDHPKARTFLRQLQQHYQGDFQAISPAIRICLNDGPAGTIAGAVEAYKRFGAHNIVFIINGSGLNTSVITRGKLFTTETGHIAASDELNTYYQTTPCGVFDAVYTCLERIGANKAGIEAQWNAITGQVLTAKQVEDEYRQGNRLAFELYEHAAWVTAHVVAGTAHIFDLALQAADSAIVGHGGAFKFPDFGERLQQLLTVDGQAPRLIMTKDFGPAESNACLDGAAIAALTL